MTPNIINQYCISDNWSRAPLQKSKINNINQWSINTEIFLYLEPSDHRTHTHAARMFRNEWLHCLCHRSIQIEGHRSHAFCSLTSPHPNLRKLICSWNRSTQKSVVLISISANIKYFNGNQPRVLPTNYPPFAASVTRIWILETSIIWIWKAAKKKNLRFTHFSTMHCDLKQSFIFRLIVDSHIHITHIR